MVEAVGYGVLRRFPQAEALKVITSAGVVVRDADLLLASVLPDVVGANQESFDEDTNAAGFEALRIVGRCKRFFYGAGVNSTRVLSPFVLERVRETSSGISSVASRLRYALRSPTVRSGHPRLYQPKQ